MKEFNESYSRYKRKYVAERFPRNVHKAGGLSPQFIEEYKRQRRFLLDRGLKESNVDAAIAKSLRFHKWN